MRNKRWFIFTFFLFAQLSLFSQHEVKKVNEVPASFCISQMDMKLYTMINEYRAQYDLPPIPLSRSLCYVASLHVKDLLLNHPDKGACNSHSWSSNGPWKPFCYPQDENKKNSVWDKPKELTNYKGKGFEIVYWENSSAVIDSVISFWKSMEYFNSFLMNTGKWTGRKWEAIGVSIYKNYASAWFGEIPDQEPQPVVCGTVPPEPQKKQEHIKPGVPPKATPQEAAAGAKKPVPGSEATPTNEQASKSKAVKKQPASGSVADTAHTAGGRYYIIIKSLAPRDEMTKLLDDVKQHGYPDARIIGKESKLRLSVMDFPEKPAADSVLKVVKKKFPDAWILKY